MFKLNKRFNRIVAMYMMNIKCCLLLIFEMQNYFDATNTQRKERAIHIQNLNESLHLAPQQFCHQPGFNVKLDF